MTIWQRWFWAVMSVLALVSTLWVIPYALEYGRIELLKHGVNLANATLTFVFLFAVSFYAIWAIFISLGALAVAWKNPSESDGGKVTVDKDYHEKLVLLYQSEWDRRFQVLSDDEAQELDNEVDTILRELEKNGGSIK